MTLFFRLFSSMRCIKWKISKSLKHSFLCRLNQRDNQNLVKWQNNSKGDLSVIVYIVEHDFNISPGGSFWCFFLWLRAVWNQISHHVLCRTTTMVSHPLFRWMWRSLGTRWNLVRSIGENGSCVHFHISNQLQLCSFHFHLQFNAGKKSHYTNIHSTGWRQSRWPWQMFEDLATFATRLGQRMVGNPISTDLHTVRLVSRWCDSLGDAALCETGWLVHQKAGPKGWGWLENGGAPDGRCISY